jgi:hypothetical protein
VTLHIFATLRLGSISTFVRETALTHSSLQLGFLKPKTWL